MKKLSLNVSILAFFLAVAQVIAFSAQAIGGNEISGKIQDGYRVLTIPERAVESNFTVFRGDYLKFAIDDKQEGAVLTIPSLKVNQRLVADLKLAPFVKMKTVGEFDYSLGPVKGVIRVIEYDQPQYRVLTSEEAAEFINTQSPLILDVRTAREYAGGHLKGAIHIPVQELQGRYTELIANKKDDILIYCATGNRSTVAAKILIDNGFTRIYNLREGVHVWYKKGFPVIR